jgi:hypothetical protein
MYGIAAVISFLVAFLIKIIYLAISAFEKQKPGYLDKFKIPEDVEINSVQKEAGLPGKEGEIYAAIALALHLYNKDLTENEDLKMTIQKSMKPYSPWSSKIYGLNQWKR